jgi:hypothetical protein
VPGGPARSGRADVLILGLGLGGIFSAATQLDELVGPGGLPSAPSTALDTFIPLFAGIPDIPASALGVLVALGIPCLVVAGLTSRRSWRAVIATAMLVLLAAIAWSLESMGDGDPAWLALLGARWVVVVIGIALWGARSAWSWLVAALSYQGLNGLRDALYGAEWQARGAGALTVVVTAALIAVGVRRAGRDGLVTRR